MLANRRYKLACYLVLVILFPCVNLNTNYILVYRVKESNVILILQRSLSIKGAQKLLSQQLYNLLLVELEGKSMLLFTGASTEDVESASRYTLPKG